MVARSMWQLWRAVSRYTPYMLVALIILGPALAPGYIFAPDMVFTPVMPWPAVVTPAYPLQVTLHYTSLIMSAWGIQKLLLLAALAGSGVGAHRFVAYLRPRVASGVAWCYACYAGGLLYMANPFVYSRLMTGQYYLLLGYMLLPFFARALWRFVDAPQLPTAVALAVSLTCIAVVSPHIFGMAFLLLAVAAVAGLWRNRRQRAWLWASAIYGGGALAAVLLAGSYWLLPLVRGSGTASVVHSFGATDRTAFATTGHGVGRLLGVLGLQGFWGDAQNLYTVPADMFGWWWLPFILLGALLSAGVVAAWRWRRGSTAALLACMTAAALLAVGTPLNDWLAVHIPLFAGYREPQKFVGLLALGYVWLAACGTAAGIIWLQQCRSMRPYAMSVAVTAVVLPFLCAPLLLWGGNGQLHAVQYPADWYAANSILQSDTQSSPPTVLCVPWHGYVRLGFAQAVAANPAARFFDAKVITNTNPEFAGASSYVTNHATVAAGRLLQTAPARTDMAVRLASQHITYVLVLKEADYQQYAYVAAQPGLQTVYDGATLTLYKVTSKE